MRSRLVPRFLVAYSLTLLVGCAVVEPTEPKSEPVDVQVAARTGFLLEQIAVRDKQLDEHEATIAALKLQAVEEKARQQELLKELSLATNEIQRLQGEVTSRDEMIRVRGRQIVAAFSKGSGCDREVERLTAERDTCYVQLAESMIPVPAPKAAVPPSRSAPPLPRTAPGSTPPSVAP